MKRISMTTIQSFKSKSCISNDSNIINVVKSEGSVSETLKYDLIVSMRSRTDTDDEHPFLNFFHTITFLFSFEGQYLTAIFYGFITYYAFPDTFHENPLVSLLIGCCSTLAVALGN